MKNITVKYCREAKTGGSRLDRGRLQDVKNGETTNLVNQFKGRVGEGAAASVSERGLSQPKTTRQTSAFNPDTHCYHPHAHSSTF